MKLKLQGTDEVIVSNGGLALASAIMKSLRTGRRLNRIRLGSDEPEISNQDVLRSYLDLPMMNCEFRPGSQHCQKETPEILFTCAQEVGRPFLAAN